MFFKSLIFAGALLVALPLEAQIAGIARLILRSSRSSSKVVKVYRPSSSYIRAIDDLTPGTLPYPSSRSYNFSAGSISDYRKLRTQALQRELKNQGYSNVNLTGVWDARTKQAADEYFKKLSQATKAKRFSDEKLRKMIAERRAIPFEFRTNLYNNDELYTQYLNNKEAIYNAQINLNSLNSERYCKWVDGIAGPNTKSGLKRFIHDYKLSGVDFNFKGVPEEGKMAKVIVENQDDWGKVYNRVKAKAAKDAKVEYDLCISSNKLVLAVSVNGAKVEFSTNGEVTLEANNREIKFNSPQASNDCNLDGQLCLGKNPSSSLSYCDQSISLGGGKLSLKLTSSKGDSRIIALN